MYKLNETHYKVDDVDVQEIVIGFHHNVIYSCIDLKCKLIQE